MDNGLSRRNEVYMELLFRGILAIRDMGYNRQPVACEIQADYLHNIPDYITGKNQSELFFLCKEVPFYIERIKEVYPRWPELLRSQVRLWEELEKMTPIDDSPWADEWREMKAGGWDYERPYPIQS